MKRTLKIEFVAYDRINDEHVVYLVEDRKISKSGDKRAKQLKRIQDRIFDCVDVAIQGQIAKQFPASLKKNIRIQIDSPTCYCVEIADLIAAVRQFLSSDPVYARAVQESPFVKGLRVLSGHEIGRFGGDVNRDGT